MSVQTTARLSRLLRLAPLIIMPFLPALTQAKGFTVPSSEHPTIGSATAKAKKGDTIWVEGGTYHEAVSVGPGIALVARPAEKATITGTGRENAVTLSNHSAVVGFMITDAAIGVYSSGIDNTIQGCTIYRNHQTGIMCVGHLPKIEDNVIVYNGGSGIQGWDVRSTIAAINHNTICFNNNHGISVGGNTNIIVENNIIAFNEKVGLKADPQAQVKLAANSFYANSELTTQLPTGNFALAPDFTAPKLLDFSLSSESKCRRRSAANEDLGSRMVGRRP